MAECLTPFIVKMNNCQTPVPCGKCPNCAKRRASGWSFRLQQEQKVSTTAYFITLTYDTEYVPITPHGFMDLSKRDLQLFFKRLRKEHSGKIPNSIKYYAVGEYGGKSKRPHYHIIMYNALLELMVDKKTAYAVNNGVIPLDGKSPFVCKQWTNGHITIGQLNAATVGYTLKYISKPMWQKEHQRDDRQKPFSLMSKGLGKNYLSKAMIDWHHADPENRMYINYEENKKAAMPRYYKNKIYQESERVRIGEIQRQKMLDKQFKIIEEIEKQGKNYLKEKQNRITAAIRKANFKNDSDLSDKI